MLLKLELTLIHYTALLQPFLFLLPAYFVKYSSSSPSRALFRAAGFCPGMYGSLRLGVFRYFSSCQVVFEAAVLLLLAAAVLDDGQFRTPRECVSLEDIDVLYETVSGLYLLEGGMGIKSCSRVNIIRGV
jgi:hypothetical protein